MRSTGPTVDASLPFITQLRLLVQPAELRGLTHDLRPTVPALAQLTNGDDPADEEPGPAGLELRGQRHPSRGPS